MSSFSKIFLLWTFLWMLTSCGVGGPAQTTLEACREACGQRGVAEVTLGCNSVCRCVEAPTQGAMQ